MLLVVADLALPDRHRAKGALIGAAAAIKLVPGIFVLYLLLTRRFRAAAVAAGTFLALVAVGWAAVPAGSTDYWLHGLFARSDRVATIVGARYVSNQSLHGMAVRLLGDTATATILWVAAALVMTVAGMALAVWAHRRGEETVGVLAVAFTALLISPIAWAHHWVWIAPLPLVAFDVALRLRGRAQHVAAAVPAVVVFVVLCWPIRATTSSPLLAQSFIWRAPHFHPDHTERYSGPVQWIFGESYTLTALGLFVLAALWLRVTGRTGDPQPQGGPATALPAPPAAPTDATPTGDRRGC